MRAIYEELINNSLGATLSAIEIYNKPDFAYRNETFVILIINAWELLLKAKILKDSSNDRTSLYVIENSKESRFKYKRSRTGNYLTIEIRRALEKLSINIIVKENLESLLDIRDTAIHFYNKETISYTIFALGAAALQNYQKLIKLWFNKDLSKYNFYILPLGFKYSFENFTTINISDEPEAIQNLLKQITAKQRMGEAESDGYYLVADIKANVVSAQKLSEESDITIAIDSKSNAKGITRIRKVTDAYPYTATELVSKVKEQVPDISQNKIWEVIKSDNVKKDPKYSMYNFPSKKAEKEYESGKIPKNVPSIYNLDAIEYLVARLSSN